MWSNAIRDVPSLHKISFILFTGAIRVKIHIFCDREREGKGRGERGEGETEKREYIVLQSDIAISS